MNPILTSDTDFLMDGTARRSYNRGFYLTKDDSSRHHKKLAAKLSMFFSPSLTYLSAIRFTGTSYIDLGVYLYRDSEVELDITTDDASTSTNKGVFGARNGNNLKQFVILTNVISSAKNTVRYDFCWSNSDPSPMVYSDGYTKGERIKVKKSGWKNYMFNSETGLYEEQPENGKGELFSHADVTALLGAINDYVKGGPYLYYVGLIHSVTLKRGTETLFDLVPVMKNGRGYFLNRVDGSLLCDTSTGDGFPETACVK